MGDSATAMRDPIFYRWHANVDDIFNMYKSKLPAYGDDKVSSFVKEKKKKKTWPFHFVS